MRPDTASPGLFSRSGGPRPLHSFPTRRSSDLIATRESGDRGMPIVGENRKSPVAAEFKKIAATGDFRFSPTIRSEEQTSELQPRRALVCRLPPEKKKTLLPPSDSPPSSTFPTR